MPDDSLRADAERLLAHELLRTWRELNRSHFENTLRPPVLTLVDTRGTLGRWVPDGRILEISRPLVLDHPWGTVVEVLKHEMAHQYVFEVLQVADGPAHGPVFQRVCDRLAIDGRARGLPAPVANDDDRIVRRIKRLLALAESDNVHEAQAAATAAQRLMLKHNVELLESGPRGYGFRQIGSPKARTPAHEKQVAGILAAHFFVEAIWVPAFDARTSTRGWVLELCGTPENLEIATYVHGFLLETADRLWARHRREHDSGNKDRRRYLLGVMMGFEEKLETNARQAAQEEGLVWVGDSSLDGFVKKRHPHLVTTHGSPVAVDHALASGRAAGREIVLHKPIGAARGNRGRLLE
jgi:hypothetical protein